MKEKKIVIGVEVIENKKVLYIQLEDKIIQLDSLYDEKPILDKWMEQMSQRNFRSRYLLFGLGNGMYVRKLLENICEEAEIIVWEPSQEIFEFVQREFDLNDILENKQVHLVVGEEAGGDFRKLLQEYLEIHDLQGSVVRSYLNYTKIFPKLYQKFYDSIKFQANSIQANQTLMVRMGQAYFDNTFANYPYMTKAKSIINLSKLLPEDIPAILVASGPSLDQNVQELKKAKNKSFIIAVDSAARALVKNGVIPDIIMSIDALKLCKHFADPVVQKVPLITMLHCSRGALQLHQGDKYFVQDKNDHVEAIFDQFQKMVVKVEGGGSVAAYAYALLERMKFQTIILVGLDLAYTNDKTHSAATLRGEMGMNIYDSDTLLIEDIEGHDILTSYEFQIYLDWFVEEMKVNPQYRVIDATEGGAKIAGTEIKTLKEAIEQECKKEVMIDKIMGQTATRLTMEEQVIFESEIKKVPENLQELVRKIKKTIRKYEKMLQLVECNRYHSSEMKRLFRETTELMKEVENSPVYYYVWCLSFARLDETFSYDLYAGEAEEKKELISSINQALHYCKVLEEETNQTIQKARSWLGITWDDVERRKEIAESSGNTEEMKRLFGVREE